MSDHEIGLGNNAFSSHVIKAATQSKEGFGRDINVHSLESIADRGVNEVKRGVATKRNPSTISEESTSGAESVGLCGILAMRSYRHGTVRQICVLCKRVLRPCLLLGRTCMLFRCQHMASMFNRFRRRSSQSLAALRPLEKTT